MIVEVYCDSQLSRFTWCVQICLVKESGVWRENHTTSAWTLVIPIIFLTVYSSQSCTVVLGYSWWKFIHQRKTSLYYTMCATNYKLPAKKVLSIFDTITHVLLWFVWSSKLFSLDFLSLLIIYTENRRTKNISYQKKQFPQKFIDVQT